VQGASAPRVENQALETDSPPGAAQRHVMLIASKFRGDVMKNKLVLLGLFVWMFTFFANACVVIAAQDLELDAGSLESFNLISKVIKKGSNFYYQLYFHDQHVINSVLFWLNEKHLKELLNFIDKAEKQIEKLRASNIKEITVKIGSLKAAGNNLDVSVMKEPEQRSGDIFVPTETSMCFQIWDRHKLNHVGIYRRGDR
jgi:hypothetical protein